MQPSISEHEINIKKTLATYLHKFGIIQHQIGSYNYFMTRILPNIIHEYSYHEIKIDNKDDSKDTKDSKDTSASTTTSTVNKPMYKILFGKVTLKKPQTRESDGSIHEITPNDARIRGLNYSACVLVDVTQEIYRRGKQSEWVLSGTRVFKELLVGKIPVMVGSVLCTLNQSQLGKRQPEIDHATLKECMYDYGGYFIIKGKEKVIITQETLRTNFPYVTKVRIKTSKFAYQCEIRSGHGIKMRTTSTLYIYVTSGKGGSTPLIYVKMPFLTELVPIVTIYRLLDIHTLKGIFDTLNSLETENETAEQKQPQDGPGDEKKESLDDQLKALIIQQSAVLNLDIDDIYNWVHSKLSSSTTNTTGTTGTAAGTTGAAATAGEEATSREKKIQAVHHIIANELLPHMGNGKIAETPAERKTNIARKAHFLGYALRKTYTYFKEGKEDDIDDIGNKRFTSPGVLMALLCRPTYRNMLKVMKMLLERSLKNNKYTTVTDVINSRLVTHAFRYALSTGNWGILKNSDQQTGVAQVLSRNQVFSTVSHITRINHNINRKGRVSKPRQVHPSHWMLIDPIETPESEGCGLQKQFAFLSGIRIGFQPEPIITLLLSKEFSRYVAIVPLLETTVSIRKNFCPVFVNMILIGYVDDSQRLLLAMTTVRQKQWIPAQTSIILKNNEFCIDVDEGCSIRPVFVTDKLSELTAFFKQNDPVNSETWIKLIDQGFVVYLDKREADATIVADEFPWTKRNKALYTEIHASLQTGVCGSLIPFADLNQTPRNIYQANMQKQTVAMPNSNFQNRFDSMFHVLEYIQKPLVTTMTADALKYNEIPAGVNAMVLIACYNGYNVEDAIIFNKRSKDFGMFRSSFYRTYHETEHKYGTHREVITTPDLKKCKNIKDANYSKLQEDGIPKVGQQMAPNDILIGKVLILNHSKKKDKGGIPGIDDSKGAAGLNQIVEEFRDQSVPLRSDEPCQVDKVIRTQNKDATSSVTVRTRATRKPEVGDKFCFTGDHDVLTDQGWIPIADVTGKHKVAVLSNGQFLGYENPTALYEYDCQNEELYEIQSQEIDLCVTKNHKLWVKQKGHDRFELIEAFKLFDKQVRFQKNAAVNFTCQRELLITNMRETRSQKDADDFQTLCLHAGWSCDVQKIENDKWKLTIHKRTSENQPVALIKNTRLYSGKVYCIEVPSHVLYIRRNGKPCFSGNSSRHGQKGVLGIVMEPEDLPVAPDGSVPDIIINPHSMPSRMTIGQLAESLMGLLCLATGKIGDGTIFRPRSVTQIAKAIHDWNQTDRDKNGNANVKCPPTGNFQFINGMTGEPMKGKTLFFGPVFYQRLKHMPIDKIHCLTPDHEVLTEDGWTLGIDIDIKKTKIATLESKEGKMTYAYASKKFIYDYAGDLYHIKNDELDFIVTPNHRMWCTIQTKPQWEFILANEIYRLHIDVIYRGLDDIFKCCAKTDMHKIEDYKGQVFCFEVPGNIFCVRRKAKAVWTGNSRAGGPVQILTRQPQEGRSRDGGLRFGEMERDAIIGHGGSGILQDRLMLNSDKFLVVICSKCGHFAQKSPPHCVQTTFLTEGPYCRPCKTGQHCVPRYVPYAWKLLYQELQAMHIQPRMILK
jgi:DNA-directed RNA polymerase II subunit RPB2